jgi:PAS domain S-box-containing protein
LAPFEERVGKFLDGLTEQLGASWAALVELEGTTGRFLPCIRARSTRAPAEHGLGPEVLEAWLTTDTTHADGISSWRLDVTPALAPSGDSALVVGWTTTPSPPPPRPEAWIGELTSALSRERRDWLARSALAAMEQSIDPMELTDRHARLVHVNDAWVQLTGYSRAEAIGQPIAALMRDPVAPLHDPSFYQYTMDTIRGGRAWIGVVTGRGREGQRLVREVSVSPFFAHEAFAGNLAVRRDLGQRTEREEALARAHHEFRAVLAALPDGIAVLRADRVYFANPRLLSILDRPLDQVLGFGLLDFVHPQDRASMPGELTRGLAGVRILRPDGSLRYVEIAAAGVVSFEGSPARILVARDTTDLRVSQERLAHADKLTALGELAAGVAHEINNPLTYMLTNIELLLEGQVDPTEDLLRETLEGGRRVRTIVSELRSFTRVDAREPQATVDVTRAVTSAVNIAQNQIRHRARLERQLMPALFARAQEGPLVQVFVNLLINAAQSIDEESPGRAPMIRVVAHAEHDDVVVLVEDTGRGIDPHVLAHVFEPFFTTKPKGTGSGLGLSISKRIVESFGGRIAIESRAHHGTAVRVHLPRLPPLAT